MNGLALTLLPLLLHVCGACTGGWHSFRSGGPCFKIFHSSHISWNNADRKCRDSGTVLAQVPDHSTHTHLISLISSTDRTEQFFHIGATNLDGSWKWTNLRTHLTHSHSYWQSGTPDNYCPVQTCDDDQNCLAYTNKNHEHDLSHWAWDDIRCGASSPYNYYICEKNAVGHIGPIVG